MKINKFTNVTMEWLLTTKMLTFPRRYMGGIINKALFFMSPERAEVFALINRVRNETEMLLTDPEAYQIYATVKATEKIIGDIAEVGVYNGGSAKLIRETTKKKSLYLFDTFEGLPDLGEKDDRDEFYKGQCLASFEGVRHYLKDYSNVYIYKGFFPSTSEPVKNKKFSFVHFDVDIYESTLTCLKFFYPRMNKGGAIISHDYMSKGVRGAFDEFFADKPEIVVELSACNQCLVIKTE